MGSLIVGILTLCTSLWAHPLDLGLARIALEGGSAVGEMRLHEDMVARILGIPTSQWNALTVGSHSEALGRVALGRLRSDGRPCPWMSPRAGRDGNSVVVGATADCTPGGRIEWDMDVLRSPAALDSFRVLATVRTSGGERVLSAQRGQETLRFDREGMRFSRFVQMGVAHIGATLDQWRDARGWHLPDGIDHILFVLALVLGGGGLKKLAGTITGFTVGHSITLGLAAFRVVSLPSRLVESLIALSIAFVALETLLGKGDKHRWKVAAFFGLVHGFGFANALTELDLGGLTLVKALVGYNLGVELGQLAIVLAVTPLMAGVARWPLGWRVTIPTASTGIFLSGGYWFLQRAFGF